MLAKIKDAICRDSYLDVLFFVAINIVTTIILLIFCYEIYSPDLEEVFIRAKHISHLPLGGFVPEPQEKLFFYLFFAFIPINGLLYILKLKKLIRNLLIEHEIKEKVSLILTFLLSLSSVFLTIYTSSYKAVDVSPAMSYGQFYFYQTIIGHKEIFLGSFVFIGIFYFIFQSNKEKLEQGLKYDILIWAAFLVAVFFTLLKEPYPVFNNAHFEALFFSQYVVTFAKEPMYVDGFKNTYGLYPHFLDLYFQFIPLTIDSFKNLLVVLLLISYTFLFLFLKLNLASKVLSLLISVSYVYYTTFYRLDLTNDFYFQYFPLRILFPFITLYLVSKYEDLKSRPLFYFISILMGLAILWQTDSGLMSFVMWCSYLLYKEIDLKNLKKAFMPFPLL